MILSNKAARHIALASTGLHHAPLGPCDKTILLDLIKALGYVQQDPLQVVARAHDHILWSRNNQYRPKLLDRLMEEDRSIFEHFGHDACVLPVDVLPYWTDQFKRRPKKHTPSKIYTTKCGKQAQSEVLERIKNEGPLRSKDFKTKTNKKTKQVWEKPEHKQVLDYLWLKGDLAVSKRVKFSKYYDLAERIYPQKLIDTQINKNARTEYLAMNAIERLGFATVGEIMRFWELSTLPETRSWCSSNNDLISVCVQSADGAQADALSHKSLSGFLAKPPIPTKRLRIINPFDPIMRDRKRLLRLFGFDFRIEIYVPPKQRKYGYYVYPLLECDSFVGRIEVRHDKKTNNIHIDNLWNEPGFTFGKGRMVKLESELQRVRRFCGADAVVW